MKKLIACIAAFIVLTACSTNQKRVIVMSKGPAEINADAKTIKADDGSGHDEKSVDFVGDKINLSLQTPAGNATVTLTENGYYIVNVKNDTIIGSYQHYTDPATAQRVITQQVLKQKIDSLILLANGENVSAANRNFFILPNTAVKITSNFDAIIVGPYHQVRSAEKKDGKAPEVYRFYSIKEIRETILKLHALTVAKPE